jgi:hypothetical protein
MLKDKLTLCQTWSDLKDLQQHYSKTELNQAFQELPSDKRQRLRTLLHSPHLNKRDPSHQSHQSHPSYQGIQKPQGETDAFERQASLTMVILSILLAGSEILGENAQVEVLTDQTKVANCWGFYQAKTLRENMFELAAAEREIELAGPRTYR